MAAPIIRRALLYVPGSSKKMLDKSRGIASVDTVAYDLEDSVTPGKKAEARANLRQLLEQPRVAGIREQAVRINSVDSGYALDDLTEVLKAPNLDALVIPKVNSASDLHFVTDVIRHTLPQRHPSTPSSSRTQEHPPLRLIALIESARALMDLPAICKATPYLSGLIFAAEDFALDLSLTRTPSLREFLYARSAIVTAARAHNLPSAIDLVCTSFRGEEGQRALEEECADGKRLGFNGKQVIHPSQLEVAQRAFAPGEDEAEWAMRVVVADEKADRAGRGAWTLDGKMIDAPVVGKARAIVRKAEVCGFDVQALREKWKGQEPE
ncbi:Pyruvate/Phosphoenolpyruvate kinase-like domain-containing protein [Macrophomina phaseolina]|uniref:Pyruvate/Phosphoenolpyruvate kinase-like domain-containing protein n=1 Tax=Macrophomina phaseolina TaxID=35725 RepID=A0ABQ8GLX7_9PEZI|nr:Pyruvate/Phosphoenolpyruvate kinase-like domain-containing protein [Macrophomina phaseolina]